MQLVLQNFKRTVTLFLIDVNFPTYNAILNFLGLPVLRSFLVRAYFRYQARKTISSEVQWLTPLQKDGIVVIPNFFPEDLFQEIVKEYERAPLEDKVSWDNDGVFEYQTQIWKNPGLYPTTAKHLLYNSRLNLLAAQLLGEKQIVFPKTRFQKLSRKMHEKTPSTLIGTNYPHPDHIYPVVKMWLYLNDAKEGEGVFYYARGTHKMTLRSIFYEYRVWQRLAKLKKIDPTHKKIPLGEATHPTTKEWWVLAKKLEPVLCKANTLVIANTSGIHMRGQMHETALRKTVFLDYKYIEEIRIKRWAKV